MTEKMTYEQAVKELQKIVEKLEKGNVPLDDTVKLYEQGIKLSAFCSKKLADCNRKLLRLNRCKMKLGYKNKNR